MNEAHAFVTSVYKAIDTMDEKELAPFLAEDCTFVFGNAKPVVGRAASADASKAFRPASSTISPTFGRSTTILSRE